MFILKNTYTILLWNICYYMHLKDNEKLKGESCTRQNCMLSINPISSLNNHKFCANKQNVVRYADHVIPIEQCNLSLFNLKRRSSSFRHRIAPTCAQLHFVRQKGLHQNWKQAYLQQIVFSLDKSTYYHHFNNIQIFIQFSSWKKNMFLSRVSVVRPFF